ncbi:RndB [Desulfamplus magnetovallimortis]|uniref:RndB n=1 Tax=Desulfamplus magnetovallimortis TaxID=1246637 RepID=A0A1W1HG63_9BACT|nr:efflux RND transporter periplasmic adaptor subunit [Desulfamplus magnetovallimortis]SLM31378.1 RndB [Desulfamplus magnetovallimortis]
MTIHTNKKFTTKFLLAALVITAVTTALTMASIFYFMGFHISHSTALSGQSLMQEEESDDKALVDKKGVDSGMEANRNSEIQPSVQLWTCGMHPWVITEESGLCPICNMDLIPKRAEKTNNPEKGDKKRKIVYWKAPMDPTEIYEQPGKSKMGMELVPVYEDQLMGGVDIFIDPVVEQNMGVRMEAVEEGRLTNTIRTYGHITFDETRTAQVSPKVNGWIEKLYVNFTGVRVESGEPLLELYSPELISAQEEYLSFYLSLKRDNKTYNTISNHDQNFLESAKQRLSYFDVAEEEIKAIELSGQTRKTITIRSPFSGFVTFKNAIEGGYIKAGTNIYTITDLSRVWVEAHIYEYELDQVKVGQEAEMMLPYLPGKTYKGKVTFIYPYLQQKTRDVVVRLEFENRDMELKPEMYGDVRIKTKVAEKGMAIPSEAVILSGERNVVFVSSGNGKFTPREITTGAPLDNGKVQVLTGLAPRELVVTSGQFMLDSESKLQEAVKKMVEIATPTPAQSQSPPITPNADENPGVEDFFKDME